MSETWLSSLGGLDLAEGYLALPAIFFIGQNTVVLSLVLALLSFFGSKDLLDWGLAQYYLLVILHGFNIDRCLANDGGGLCAWCIEYLTLLLLVVIG